VRAYSSSSQATRCSRSGGARGFSIPSIDLVPRVDAYRIEMQPPDGNAFELTGTFREVDIPSRLALTLEWEPADPDDQETMAQARV
jgi:uncharacterized protein YndB with AHSA1/START domain